MGITPLDGPPAKPPVVPGFVASTLLGMGAHGAVWAAREQITGDVVALKVGRSPFDPSSAEALAGEADLLARLDHPHLIRLRRVVPAAAGATALVLDFAAGGSLAALVAARGALDPGEVVTMLIPLAQVLSDLHSQGLVHGDLAPGNVLFSGSGRPLLSDLGVSSLLAGRRAGQWRTPGFGDPAGGAGGQASDVWGLGALAWFALTAQAPPGPFGMPAPDNELDLGAPAALKTLIQECLSASPKLRPLAADVARRAWTTSDPAVIVLPIGPGQEVQSRAGGALCAADPLLNAVTARSAGSGDRPSDRHGGRGGWAARRWRLRRAAGRRLAGVLLGCGLVGVAGFALVATRSGGSLSLDQAGRRADQPPSMVTVGDVEERAAVTALDQIAAARASAFSQASVAPLARADEPGSAAERLDADLVRRLREARLRLVGVSYLISDVRVTSARPDDVEVTALVSTSAHRQVGPAGSGGAGGRQIAATGPQRVRLRLVRGPARQWLIRSAEPVAGEARTSSAAEPAKADQGRAGRTASRADQ